MNKRSPDEGPLTELDAELDEDLDALVPLTTMIGGSPSFVFDSFGRRVMTEVPR